MGNNSLWASQILSPLVSASVLDFQGFFCVTDLEDVIMSILEQGLMNFLTSVIKIMHFSEAKFGQIYLQRKLRLGFLRLNVLQLWHKPTMRAASTWTSLHGPMGLVGTMETDVNMKLLLLIVPWIIMSLSQTQVSCVLSFILETSRLTWWFANGVKILTPFTFLIVLAMTIGWWLSHTWIVFLHHLAVEGSWLGWVAGAYLSILQLL